MGNKFVRTQEERFQIHSDLASLIEIGHEKKKRVSSLIEALGGKYQEGKSVTAFKKEIERICAKMHDSCFDEEDGTGLIRVSGKGTSTEYYWSDAQEKNASIEYFTITKPRALALFLVKQHIADILPVSYLSALEDDFKKAQKRLDEDGIKLDEVLEYSPFGLSLDKSHANMQCNTHIIDTVFEALLSQKVLILDYHSIHAEYSQTAMEVSPQKLRYLNNQLQLLAHVHKTGAVKHFNLAKIGQIEIANAKEFIKLDASVFEAQYVLRLRCHSWVKDFFTSTRLGANLSIRLVSSNVWELTDRVAFPKHFRGDKPDGFYVANFLSMFSDSIEVLEPSFLRNEMQRRSASLNRLYSDTSDAIRCGILSDSPEDMANL
jgi:predicted DNA-binding transcriptional regulator YafY